MDRHVLTSWLASRALICVSRDPGSYTRDMNQLVTRYPRRCILLSDLKLVAKTLCFRKKTLFMKTTKRIVLLNQVTSDEVKRF